MYAGVEHVEVLAAECVEVAHCAAKVHLFNKGREVCHVSHFGAFSQILVAECRQLGVVSQSVGFELPFAKQWSYDRSHQATHVDEYVEDLEA